MRRSGWGDEIGPDRDEVEERLVESVRMQLLADAPVVCAAAAASTRPSSRRSQRGSTRISPSFTPTSLVRSASTTRPPPLPDTSGSSVKVVPVADADSLDTLPEVMLHYGHPFTYHPNSVPFLMVSKLVRNHGVKGILSGEGSDESYIGYPWLIFDLRAFLLQWPRKAPGELFRLLRAAMQRMRSRPVRHRLEEALAVIRGLHDRFEIE